MSNLASYILFALALVLAGWTFMVWRGFTRLLTIHNCIQAGKFDADTLDALVQTKNAWAGMKNRVDSYLGDIHQIISQTSAAMRPVRDSLVAA